MGLDGCSDALVVNVLIAVLFRRATREKKHVRGSKVNETKNEHCKPPNGNSATVRTRYCHSTANVPPPTARRRPPSSVQKGYVSTNLSKGSVWRPPPTPWPLLAPSRRDNVGADSAWQKCLPQSASADRWRPLCRRESMATHTARTMNPYHEVPPRRGWQHTRRNTLPGLQTSRILHQACTSWSRRRVRR